MRPPKQPFSALVLVYTTALDVLLLERADAPGFWQSVTGSCHVGEPIARTAARELGEETGIDAVRYGGVADWRVSNRYAIFQHWRHRYAEGTTHNLERVFGLALPAPVDVQLAPREHLRFEWLPWRDAARRCFSWSNRDAILMLPRKLDQVQRR